MSCGLDICYCQSNSIIYNILYCFNISHVTLYRKYSCQNSRRRWVSIHLMLLFIFFCILFLLSPSWFQYISCYSWSVQGAAEMPWLISFNTSHVTLYLQQMVADADEVTFQHISCYSLSDQYTVKPFSNTVSIHLMLLFILETVRDHPEYSRFNTSHVTLYREEVVWYGTENCVSIHLMLLFIVLAKPKQYAAWRSFNTSHVTLYLTAHEPDYPILKFQYISCYSLSLARI